VHALHRKASFQLTGVGVLVPYDWPTVLLSLIAAVFAAAVALFVVSRKKMGWPRALAGSAIMGGGMATMHYHTRVRNEVRNANILTRGRRLHG